MIDVTGIDHIVLRTPQLAHMLNFYVNILGCAVERETSAETGLTQLRAGSALIDLVTLDSRLGKMGGPAPKALGNNVDHFCLSVKSVPEQSLINHLEKHGVQTQDFVDRYGAQGFGRSIYITDPDQNTVELRLEK